MTRIEDIVIRPATTDADLQAWIDVRRAVVPNESTATIEQLRASGPDRLLVVAELGGRLVGSGFADRSQVEGGFVAPRILPEHRRRGAASAILVVLLEHLAGRGFSSVRADASDDASFAFATRHGFEEIDRQVEQVRTLAPDEPAAPPYPGVEFWTVAQRPELLQRSYALAREGYADMALTTGPATVSIDEWLRDEATLPGGSFVALEHGMIVGYAGLIAWNGDPSRAENGLTVVDRRWRRRGLATALKRRQLAWAGENGIREIVTWTQQGNDAMRRVNAGLGYRRRATSRTVRRELP
jgi:mycothiol synthase